MLFSKETSKVLKILLVKKYENGCLFTSKLYKKIYFKSTKYDKILEKTKKYVKILTILIGQGLCYKCFFY